MQRKRVLSLLLLCLGAVLLAACGTHQASASNAGTGGSATVTVGNINVSGTGSMITPTAPAASGRSVTATVGKANAPAGSVVTPTVPASSNRKVTVTVGKAKYAPNAIIMITINNGLVQSIGATNHQSGCTMVTLQWQDARGTWQDQNRCRLGAMTRMITLPPHSSQVQVISPISGTFAKSAQWAKGTYRVVFTFTLGNTTDGESIPITGGSGSPIYSSTFVVA